MAYYMTYYKVWLQQSFVSLIVTGHMYFKVYFIMGTYAMLPTFRTFVVYSQKRRLDHLLSWCVHPVLLELAHLLLC